VAQGTIQVKQQRTSLMVKLNPTPDCMVKRNNQEYTVFVEKPPESKKPPESNDADKELAARVFTIERPFEVEPFLADLLIQAALAGGNVEISVEINGKSSKT